MTSGQRVAMTKRVLGYFEHYTCGCVSEVVRYKKDLLGYCGSHGNDRQMIYPAKLPTKKGKR